MALNQYKKIRGATLIESLTALTIVSTVMGSAFTLYEKIVSGEQQVMRTRAKYLQMEAENLLDQPGSLTNLTDEFIELEVEEENYSAHVKHIAILFRTKSGKLVAKKNYIRYQP